MKKPKPSAEEALRESKGRFHSLAEKFNPEQEELLETTERLNALLDHNPALIFLKDEEGRYVYLNKAYEKQFIPSGDWYGKTDFDFWSQESAELFRANDNEVLNSGRTIQFLEDSTDSKGTRYCWLNYKFPFMDSKNRKYIGGIGIDATRFVIAEEASKESETKYRELVQYAPAGIYEVDFRSKRFTSVNDVMSLITGYSREELLNMAPFNILDEASAARFRQRIDLWLSGKEPAGTVDYKIRTKDGREIDALLNVKFIRDQNGNPLGASVIAHDITDRKRAEEALRESEKRALALVKELEEADKNKNRFISVLSHELRNPLAAISAGIQILDITDDAGQTEKAKEIIKRQTSHLGKLVDDLLELTRISQNKIDLKKIIFDLKKNVKETVEDIRPEFAAKNVELETEMETKPVFIKGDSVRIKQVMGNVLTNSLKFTPAGGRVRLILKTEGKDAVISVEDNGVGIEPHILPHLFTPFTQADNTLARSGGGLGLGLSIVKGIVDMHGGSVSAFSQGLGKGAAFTISLPVTTQQNPLPEKSAEHTSVKKGLKLLVIEDNRDIADLLRSMLAVLGYGVEIAYDGEEGLKLAREIKPDVVFCDIGLPVMSGYDVAVAIRADEELKGIYLIALTGYTGEGAVERVFQSGFDRHISKPFDLIVLENVLQEQAERLSSPVP